MRPLAKQLLLEAMGVVGICVVALGAEATAELAAPLAEPPLPHAAPPPPPEPKTIADTALSCHWVLTADKVAQLFERCHRDGAFGELNTDGNAFRCRRFAEDPRLAIPFDVWAYNHEVLWESHVVDVPENLQSNTIVLYGTHTLFDVDITHVGKTP